MHRSLLSDCFLSDRLHDGGRPIDGGPVSLGQAHKAGVVRGLVFVLAVAIPFALAFASGQRNKTSAPADSSSVTSPG